jgi:hypothetical protein
MLYKEELKNYKVLVILSILISEQGLTIFEVMIFKQTNVSLSSSNSNLFICIQSQIENR